MLFVIGSLLAIAFLDAPERFFVMGALAAVDILQVFLWLRWRRVRSITGSEAMVGMRGKALTDCKPDGQVRVKGQIWKAHCREGVTAGEGVVLTGSRGLVLEVTGAATRVG